MISWRQGWRGLRLPKVFHFDSDSTALGTWKPPHLITRYSLLLLAYLLRSSSSVHNGGLRRGV